jgi:periplasmic divalent cation tolerance protein
MSVISVYAVFADLNEAERISRLVVEERLAACVNVLGPIRSIYRWKGTVDSAEEIGAIFKTTVAQADSLITRIAGLHSYEVPCIATWPIDKILYSYAEWVDENVG